MTQIRLSGAGVLSLGATVSPALVISATTKSYLGDDASLDIAFFAKVANPLSGDDITVRLTWFDSTTDDQIFKIQGTLSNDEDDLSSIQAVADAAEIFGEFSLILGSGLITAVKNCVAFNAYNGLNRNSFALPLPSDQPPPFDADQVYDILTAEGVRPAYLVLPTLDDLELYNTVYRAADKLNIPMDCEIDPTITPEQAADLALNLDAQDQRVQLIWSPNICRPRDAVSLRGRKVPAYAIGAYLGMKLLRNARTTAEGIPKIGDPVAGYDFPFTMKGLEMRPDVVFNEQTLEMLAKAKVNTVRRMSFGGGVRFVLSDGLTQRQSKNSALRLVNATEIACYTSNIATDILNRHMLRRMSSYLTDASREIEAFLKKCAAPTVGLLQPAADLGGAPYVFSLTPDADYPFERVRLYMARGIDGMTRAAIFDKDILSK
ncbi:hypothetical protein [Alkanindiges illinoisensis]|uniref:hypothetical protein n=1 Tax=Alkanindiges illinoisensis TaxID=197183 RepID=UPI00047CA7A8|nr:hypothetical protein [Alkanindiges illinoisensis]